MYKRQVKRSAVAPEMLVHSGPARVFDGEESAIDAIYNLSLIHISMVFSSVPSRSNSTARYKRISFFQE